MIPELGHFALILALAVALVQAVLPLAGSYLNHPAWLALARPAAGLQWGLMVMSFGCLAASFLGNDFSVAYVAQHSNSLLPKPYQFAAVWGGHEGSLLLWIVMLSGWGGAVALFSSNLPLPMVARVLSVMGWVGIGFLAFILTTSNPFDRLLPAAPEGRPDAQRVEVTGGRGSDTEQRRQSTVSKIVIGRDEIERQGDSTLGEILKQHGATALVSAATARDALGGEALGARPEGEQGVALARWLQQLEAANAHVVCIADEELPGWSVEVLRQAGHRVEL